MKLLLLAAGDSRAFQEAGYRYPKNLTEVEGVPLIQRVLENLQGLLDRGSELIALIRRDENSSFHTADVVRLLVPEATVIEVPDLTSGAACTALLAVEHFAPDEPLLVFNGDQIVARDLASVVDDFQERELDGGVVVFHAVHPRWSYVRCDEAGFVIEAAEKRPISTLATAGTYYYARGKDFVENVTTMILKDAHVGGQFYVCPAYNEMILRQARIGIYEIDRSEYFSLATPQGVTAYEEFLSVSRNDAS